MNELLRENLVVVVLAGSTALFLLFFFNLYLIFKYNKIKKLSEDFFAGKKGKDLEEVIQSQKKQISRLEKDIKELFDGYEKIYKMAFKGIHKVGVVRYNPFNDIGGNQSFVVALLDGDKSGVVITSLHTREGTRIFSKAIFEGGSLEGALTEEEERAIKMAKVSKRNKKV